MKLIGDRPRSGRTPDSVTRLDEDEHDEGYQRPTYRDTAAMGVVLAAAGLASTALGAVLLYRDRSVPVVPIVTVADHHVLLSFSGAF